MLKYCNDCKRDLENDNFYSYKKSICKQCVNKKVKCDYCDKEFNSTNLSKHIKQRHNTFDSSRTNDTSRPNDSTHDSTYNSTHDNNSSMPIKYIDENYDPLYPTIKDGLYLNEYAKLLEDKIKNLDMKTLHKIDKILTKSNILNNKIMNKTITKIEEKQYENNLRKLKDLDYFDERLCKILLKYKYLD